MKTFTVTKQQKISKEILANVEGLSYAAIMKLIREKDVKVNGVRVKTDSTVNIGDIITVYNKGETLPTIRKIYEDAAVLVVGKPSGVLSEAFYRTLKNDYGELYFIHRLDRNTSGVMIFAKTPDAEEELIEGFKRHKFDKKYLAEVYGIPEKDQAILTAYLKKDAGNSLVRIYDKATEGSTPIKTGYKIIEKYGDTSLLEVTLYTGKTHQIRAHLSHIGHFVVGDGKYGDNRFNKSKKATTQRLTAYSLTVRFDKNSPLHYLDGKVFKI